MQLSGCVAVYDAHMQEPQPDSQHPTVERAVDLDADPADVWRAISDPAQLAEWLGASVDVELRPGAAGTIVDDEGVRHAVLVTDVDAGKRIAWHWWDTFGELSSVEISLEPTGDATRVRVVERLVRPDAAPVASAACGRRWERATARLWHHVVAHAAAW